MVGEEQHRFLVGIGGCGQHGMMAGRMEAKHDLAARGSFHAQPLRADGDAAISADLEGVRTRHT